MLLSSIKLLEAACAGVWLILGLVYCYLRLASWPNRVPAVGSAAFRDLLTSLRYEPSTRAIVRVSSMLGESPSGSDASQSRLHKRRTARFLAVSFALSILIPWVLVELLGALRPSQQSYYVLGSGTIRVIQDWGRELALAVLAVAVMGTLIALLNAVVSGRSTISSVRDGRLDASLGSLVAIVGSRVCVGALTTVGVLAVLQAILVEGRTSKPSDYLYLELCIFLGIWVASCWPSIAQLALLFLVGLTTRVPRRFDDRLIAHLLGRSSREDDSFRHVVLRRMRSYVVVLGVAVAVCDAARTLLE